MLLGGSCYLEVNYKGNDRGKHLGLRIMAFIRRWPLIGDKIWIRNF